MQRKFAVCAAAFLAVAGCSKSVTEPEQSPLGLSAMLDGAEWTAGVVTASESNAYLTISANGGGNALSLDLLYGAPATYTVGYANGGNNLLAAATLNVGTNYWVAQSTSGSGTVTITENTGSHVEGTFSLTLPPLSGGATGQRVFTQGKFSVDY